MVETGAPAAATSDAGSVISVTLSASVTLPQMPEAVLPIPSLLDNDLYKFTMGQVAHDYAQRATVRYRYINRDKREFRPGFANELRAHVDALADLKLTDD